MYTFLFWSSSEVWNQVEALITKKNCKYTCSGACGILDRSIFGRNSEIHHGSELWFST